MKEPHYLLQKIVDDGDEKIRFYRCLSKMRIISDEDKYINGVGLNSDLIPIDGSVNYYMYPTTLRESIKRLNVEPYVIFIIRDPVERAISSYNHQVAAGIENQSLEDCLIQERNSVRYCSDIMSYYVAGSSYLYPHTIFQHHFSNYRMMDYSDYCSSPHEFCNSILKFIGAEVIDSIDNTKFNATGDIRFESLNKLTDNKSFVRMILRPFLKVLSPRLKRYVILYLKSLNLKQKSNELDFKKGQINKYLGEQGSDYEQLLRSCYRIVK